jgi:hypothetical protein
MPEDQNVEIRIKATADTKGFKETQDAAENLGKVGTSRFRDMKAAARGLALEFPLLGRVMSLALNPISAIVAVAITAFGAFQRAIKGLHEAVGTTADWENNAAAIAAQRKEMEAAAIESAKFQRSLDAVASATQTVTDKTNDLIAVIRLKSRLETELSDAEEAAALANIDSQEKLGQISGEAAIASRLSISRAAEARRAAIADVARGESSTARIQERGALRGEAISLDAAIAGQEGRLGAMMSPAEIDRQIARTEKNLEAALKARKERPAVPGLIQDSAAARLMGVQPAIAGQQAAEGQAIGQLRQLLQSLMDLRQPRAIEFQTEAERLQALRARRTAVGQRDVALGREGDQALTTANIEDRFGPRISQARQTAREAGPLAELQAGVPVSPFAGTRGQLTEFSGTRDSADASVVALEKLGEAIVGGFNAITNKVQQIENQVKHLRP